MSSGNAELRNKATDMLKQAIDADKAQNFEEALALYRQALEYLALVIKYEKSPQLQNSLRDIFEQHLKRAETINQFLDKKGSRGPQGGGGDTGTSQKPRPGGDDEESARLRGALGNAIVTEKPNVKWDDVAGLEGAKEALKEAVILPVKFPQFFTGKRKPWGGILLYGPPGTGKSYLAKAVATEADSTFFALSSSDLVSKWMGESEKLVKQLFSMARENAPSIIFLDEIDALCSARGDGESEAARRIKTEFLVQMQGVGSGGAGPGVLVLAATNMPYNLDNAIRRRFDKRILIPLPDARARAGMFRIHLGDTPHSLSMDDFAALGERAEGFSGSDIAVTVKDVLMEPIRTLKDATHFKVVQGTDGLDYYTPCSPGDPDPSKREETLATLVEKQLNDKVLPPSINMAHFERVLARARPTVGKGDLEMYDKYTQEFGEEGS